MYRIVWSRLTKTTPFHRNINTQTAHARKSNWNKICHFLETEEESTHFIFHFVQDKMHLQRHVSKTRSVIPSLLLTLVIIVRYWFTSLKQHGIREQEYYPYNIHYFLRIRLELQSYIVTRWPLFYMPVNLKMSFLLWISMAYIYNKFLAFSIYGNMKNENL